MRQKSNGPLSALPPLSGLRPSRSSEHHCGIPENGRHVPACKRTQPYRRPPPCIYVPVGNHDCGLSHTPWGADWVSGTMSALGQRSDERTYQPMSDFAVCRAESSARVASFSPDIARAIATAPTITEIMLQARRSRSDSGPARQLAIFRTSSSILC